jgi:hypothetical protein
MPPSPVTDDHERSNHLLGAEPKFAESQLLILGSTLHPDPPAQWAVTDGNKLVPCAITGSAVQSSSPQAAGPRDSGKPEFGGKQFALTEVSRGRCRTIALQRLILRTLADDRGFASLTALGGRNSVIGRSIQLSYGAGIIN